MSSKALQHVLLCAIMATVAQAKVITVSFGQKIGDAIENSDPGDTVMVKRGIYNENIKLTNDVAVVGENELTTIIDGGRKGPTVRADFGKGSISGFTIRNGIEGVLCENAYPTIHRNWIIDNHASGIATFIALPDIKNNVIFGNRWSGLLVWGAKGNAQAKVENNVIIRNGYSGVSLMGPTQIEMNNNIMMENGYYGIFAEPASGQTKAEYNDIYKNYYPFNRFIKINKTNIPNGIDPKFENFSLAQPKFTVSAKSALKNRGKCKLDIGLLAAGSKGTEICANEQAQAAKVEEEKEEVSTEVASTSNSSAKIADKETLERIFKDKVAEFGPGAEAKLKVISVKMKTESDAQFKITASAGNLKNPQLAVQRANVVKNWLVKNGVNASQLTTEASPSKEGKVEIIRVK
jgi:outer membrane protein OmpA-like peptidoglycan-associated protein